MSTPELNIWRAKYRLSPFGSRQEDLRAAFPTALLYNANKKKGSEALGPDVFFPSLKKRDGMTPEERLVKQVQRAAEAFSGGPPGA